MKTEKRIVMTLDAGGTNLVFSAIQDGKEIVSPITYPSEVDDIQICLQTLLKGFEEVKALLSESPVAISFAFPGPADYRAGIIGNLPNFPAFRGKGVPLGPFLSEHFGIPVFINNDGNLFAYGEALAGALPEVNALLEKAGNSKRYHNLIGITFGTGFGCGIVINQELLFGDNQTGGHIWCLRNKKYPSYIVEESVSKRAVPRVYNELSGNTSELTPKDVFDIAEGVCPGNREAAIAAFSELGTMAGDAIATALSLIDGLVVIGGGLAGAAKYILPALMDELKGKISMKDGTELNRLSSIPYCLENPNELEAFLQSDSYELDIPGTDKKIRCCFDKKIGVLLSHVGANRAIALGAYWYALNELDKNK